MKTFIILSSCPWTEVAMKQRPHHLARSLTKLGHEVHFFNPVAPQVIDVEITEASIEELVIDRRKTLDGVFVYKNFYGHIGRQPYNTVFPVSNTIAKGKKKEDVILIVYLPDHLHLLNGFQFDYTLVYECVDEHTDTDFSYWSKKTDIDHELKLIEKADRVLTTSKVLYLNKSMHKKEVILSKNAVNTADFKGKEAVMPSEYAAIPSPRVLYVGAVFDWFEEELFYKLAETNPDKSFVIIGPVGENQLTKPASNVYKLGVKDHTELKNYLTYSDVGIIPFKTDNDLIINCDPIKMYEYISRELPVVSTEIPEVFKQLPYIKVSNDVHLFNQHIQEFIAQKPSFEHVEHVLEENSWDQRAKELIDSLRKDFSFDQYEKKTKETIQKELEEVMTTNPSPIIRSIYALTYAKTEPAVFFNHAEKAYEELQTKFTYRNYVYALYCTNQIEKATELVLSTKEVPDLYKAELLYSVEKKDTERIWINVLYTSKHFDEIKRIIRSLSKPRMIRETEIAHFFMEVGEYDEAFKLYGNHLNTPLLQESPMFSSNLSILSPLKGKNFNGELFKIRSMELIDRLLQRPSRKTEWESLFIEGKGCPSCGRKEETNIWKRADNQTIVYCSDCEIAYVKHVPKKEMVNFTNLSPYEDRRILSGFMTADSFKEKTKKQIFLPRLLWIERTSLEKTGRKLFYMGKEDEFVPLAKQSNWDVVQHSNSQELDANSIDVIAMWDVIQTVFSPKDLLQELYRILKPNGKLYLSTVNHGKGMIEGKEWAGYNQNYHQLFYFNAASLVKILTEFGFKVDQTFSHEEKDVNMTQPTMEGHILLLAARK